VKSPAFNEKTSNSDKIPPTFSPCLCNSLVLYLVSFEGKKHTFFPLPPIPTAGVFTWRTRYVHTHWVRILPPRPSGRRGRHVAAAILPPRPLRLRRSAAAAVGSVYAENAIAVLLAPNLYFLNPTVIK